MTINWLPSVHALELYGVLALAGTCLLYTFVLHMGIRAMLRRAGQDRQFLRNRLAELAESMERLRAEHEEAARPSAVPTNGQPLNLNKRGQVLRMRRRGKGRQDRTSNATGEQRPQAERDCGDHDHLRYVDRSKPKLMSYAAARR